MKRSHINYILKIPLSYNIKIINFLHYLHSCQVMISLQGNVPMTTIEMCNSSTPECFYIYQLKFLTDPIMLLYTLLNTLKCI